jgi:hypothetical protein
MTSTLSAARLTSVGTIDGNTRIQRIIGWIAVVAGGTLAASWVTRTDGDDVELGFSAAHPLFWAVVIGAVMALAITARRARLAAGWVIAAGGSIVVLATRSADEDSGWTTGPGIWLTLIGFATALVGLAVTEPGSYGPPVDAVDPLGPTSTGLDWALIGGLLALLGTIVVPWASYAPGGALLATTALDGRARPFELAVALVSVPLALRLFGPKIWSISAWTIAVGMLNAGAAVWSIVRMSDYGFEPEIGSWTTVGVGVGVAVLGTIEAITRWRAGRRPVPQLAPDRSTVSSQPTDEVNVAVVPPTEDLASNQPVVEAARVPRMHLGWVTIAGCGVLWMWLGAAGMWMVMPVPGDRYGFSAYDLFEARTLRWLGVVALVVLLVLSTVRRARPLAPFALLASAVVALMLAWRIRNVVGGLYGAETGSGLTVFILGCLLVIIGIGGGLIDRRQAGRRPQAAGLELNSTARRLASSVAVVGVAAIGLGLLLPIAAAESPRVVDGIVRYGSSEYIAFRPGAPINTTALGSSGTVLIVDGDTPYFTTGDSIYGLRNNRAVPITDYELSSGMSGVSVVNHHALMSYGSTVDIVPLPTGDGSSDEEIPPPDYRIGLDHVDIAFDDDGGAWWLDFDRQLHHDPRIGGDFSEFDVDSPLVLDNEGNPIRPSQIEFVGGVGIVMSRDGVSGAVVSLDSGAPILGGVGDPSCGPSADATRSWLPPTATIVGDLGGYVWVVVPSEFSPDVDGPPTYEVFVRRPDGAMVSVLKREGTFGELVAGTSGLFILEEYFGGAQIVELRAARQIADAVVANPPASTCQALSVPINSPEIEVATIVTGNDAIAVADGAVVACEYDTSTEETCRYTRIDVDGNRQPYDLQIKPGVGSAIADGLGGAWIAVFTSDRHVAVSHLLADGSTEPDFEIKLFDGFDSDGNGGFTYFSHRDDTNGTKKLTHRARDGSVTEYGTVDAITYFAGFDPVRRRFLAVEGENTYWIDPISGDTDRPSTLDFPWTPNVGLDGVLLGQPALSFDTGEGYYWGSHLIARDADGEDHYVVGPTARTTEQASDALVQIAAGVRGDDLRTEVSQAQQATNGDVFILNVAGQVLRIAPDGEVTFIAGGEIASASRGLTEIAEMVSVGDGSSITVRHWSNRISFVTIGD